MVKSQLSFSPRCVVSRPNRANTDVLTVCQWVLPNCRLTLLAARYKLEGKQSRETFEAHNCAWLEMAIGCWKYGLALLFFVASNAAGNAFFHVLNITIQVNYKQYILGKSFKCVKAISMCIKLLFIV